MYDVIIIGGGASGLMCASMAGKKGLKVLILEHNDRPGKKILISGGGKCNFTNLHVSSTNYVSVNPHFSKSALSRFHPCDFIEMVEKHKIPFYEKKLGQLFCKSSASAILNMLLDECKNNLVEILSSIKIEEVFREDHFKVITHDQIFQSRKLVIATGGLSFPNLGASDLGFRIARQFGIKVTPLCPALDGFALNQEYDFLKKLSGVSLECQITCENGISFRENILFTHKGLSGPAALQASLHWYPGERIYLDLLPEFNIHHHLLANSQKSLRNILASKLPQRFCEAFIEKYFLQVFKIAQQSAPTIKKISDMIKCWEIIPLNTLGYLKAEVTRGGIDTSELSSKTMESKKVPGLYFIGEVVDVTGWLGGYNFHWAWASANAASTDL